jgi:PPOX class probable F420-dependent enzyme
MELPPETREALLDSWPVARLATLRAGEREAAPHLVPVVFARSGGHLWSPIDGKPKRGTPLARLANVRARPRVALLLDHYDADWALLWWLRIDGEARVVEANEAAAEAALRRKYPQYATTPLFRDAPCWLRIAPQRSTSWCAGAAAAAAALSSSRGPAPTRDSR